MWKCNRGKKGGHGVVVGFGGASKRVWKFNRGKKGGNVNVRVADVQLWHMQQSMKWWEQVEV